MSVERTIAQHDPDAFRLFYDIYSDEFPVPHVVFEKPKLLPPSEELHLSSSEGTDATEVCVKNSRPQKAKSLPAKTPGRLELRQAEYARLSLSSVVEFLK